MALLARETPNSCSRELLAIKDYVTKRPRTQKPKTLKAAVLIVAADYRNRKHDPPPCQAGLFLFRQLLSGIRGSCGNQEIGEIAPPAQFRKGFVMTGQGLRQSRSRQISRDSARRVRLPLKARTTSSSSSEKSRPQ